MNEIFITRHYLREHPNEIFVFGDNSLHRGKRGAAVLRDEPNTYGFLTKKYPSLNKDAFFKPSEYELVYRREIRKLIYEIGRNSGKIYLISKLGAGLANKFRIFQKIIEPNIKEDLKGYRNVRFLW